MNGDRSADHRRANHDRAARLRTAGGAAAFAGCAAALAAGVALWASEGPRLFVETALSAMLACL